MKLDSSIQNFVLIFYSLSCFTLKNEHTSGKNPHAVAATVLYMASIKTRANLTQQKITHIAGIISVTIRNRLRDYKKYVEFS